MALQYHVVFINKVTGTKFSCNVTLKDAIAEKAVTLLSEHLKKQRVGSLEDYKTFSIKEGPQSDEEQG